MPAPERITLTIPPLPKYVSLARLAVAGVAARTGLTVDDIDDVKVAVSEAFTNAVDHAYTAEAPADHPHSVEIAFFPQDTELRIEVTDTGRGFDPKRVASPDAALHDRERGLGIFLIQQLMDRVDIQSAPGSGAKVTMVKRASR